MMFCQAVATARRLVEKSCGSCSSECGQVDHVGGFGGDVAGAGDGDADGGGGERGGIVDAVAHHADVAAFGGKLADAGELLFGEQAGVHFGDAGFARDGLGGAAAVAGEHDEAADVERAQAGGARLPTPSRMRSRSRMAPAMRLPSADPDGGGAQGSRPGPTKVGEAGRRVPSSADEGGVAGTRHVRPPMLGFHAAARAARGRFRRAES